MVLTVTKEVWVKAKPSSVFAVLTHGHQLVEAFPLNSATIDPKVGGAVTMTGETEDGEFTDHCGRYRVRIANSLRLSLLEYKSRKPNALTRTT